MDIFTELEQHDTDTKEGLERFIGNKEFYQSMMMEFADYSEENDPGTAFEDEDYNTAFLLCHTLKGMTGNLSFMGLYNGYSLIVKLLREKKYHEAAEKYTALKKDHESIISVIKKYS